MTFDPARNIKPPHQKQSERLTPAKSVRRAEARVERMQVTVLVLPLTVPVLIFGVAASNAAIVGPLPFGTPFTILCALTLVSLVIGTFAAAAALRHGME